jgi:protein-disulfide isomerase
VRLGATGTPTFIINGRRLTGAQPLASFTALIDQELARADAVLAEGTPRAELYDRLIADGAQRFAPPPPPPSAQPKKPAYQSFAIPAKATPISGSPRSLVTVVEVISYQCPFCGRAEGTMKALEEKYGKDLRRVVIHNPLSFHDRARDASKAVMFAAQRKKGAQMHALLLENQRALTPEDLEGYARQLGLSPAQLRKTLASKEFDKEIERQIALANQVGASGTPTFFINGRRIVGAQPQATFEAAIDEELARAREALKNGVPRAKLYETLSAGPK